MDTIEFNGIEYPKFQSEGNASQFAIPFAKYFCKGVGVDIGFSKEEWIFPGAIGVDLSDSSNNYDAMSLPYELDYIYSSHCLEHLPNWVEALEFWKDRLSQKLGTLFLYLPHPDQEYWKPWNNKKHLHILHPEDVKACMEQIGFKNIQVSKRDLNHSYIIVGEL